jgi:hypothetical protein
VYDFPPYVERVALIRFETLTRRRSNPCVMFVFDVLSDRFGSPNLLSFVNVIAPRSRTGVGNFLRIDCHCTNYGVHMNDVVRHFNEVAGLFDFHL